MSGYFQERRVERILLSPWASPKDLKYSSTTTSALLFSSFFLRGFSLFSADVIEFKPCRFSGTMWFGLGKTYLGGSNTEQSVSAVGEGGCTPS